MAAVPPSAMPPPGGGAAPPPAPMPTGQPLRGVVKQVLSGDTLVVQGAQAPSGGPPPEKQITLAHLSAPRLGNRNAPDAPFAWRAREWLRALTIGKPVVFVVKYANASGRNFGAVTMADGTNVGLAVVAEGWARVHAPRAPGGDGASADGAALGGGGGGGGGEVEQLLAAEGAAQQAGKGMWTTEDGAAQRETRVVDYAPDPAALVGRLRGQRCEAVVEHVLSGSSLRLLLLPHFEQVTLLLAGVLTPSIRRGADGGPEEAQPYAREARFFTESRVLHRTVRASLGGVDKSGALVGCVFHVSQEIDLGVELLKAGLARVADWSIQYSPAAPQLRHAEASAKAARLALWRGYSPPVAAGGMGEYTARVVEAVSADTLVVVPVPPAGAGAGAPAPADERRVYLASVRAPRLGNERRGDLGEPYSYEAKEAARRLAVGRRVKVVPEYVRKLPATEGGEGGGGGPARPEAERVYATVFTGERTNLGEKLISLGLAHANTLGRSDERSAHIDALMEAERGAKEAKVGVHSGKKSSALTPAGCQDLTLPGNRERARAFLPALQRDARVRAVVLHVVNGGRYKLLVPKEACVLSFALAGVRCPQTARRDQPGGVAEPYADEALAFARAHLLQRDVEIEVEAVDKAGTFLGHVTPLDTKKPTAPALLEAGLARRIPPAADRSRHAAELEAAERRALDARLRIWADYEEPAEAAAEEEGAGAEAAMLLASATAALSTAEGGGAGGSNGAGSAATAALVEALGRLTVLDVSGTDVVDGATFYAQPARAETARHAEAIATALARAAEAPPLREVKAGATVAAPFAADGLWYRAKVLSLSPGAKGGSGRASVSFVDYGNQQDVAVSDLRPLDPSLLPSAIPPLAVKCSLAYIAAPPVGTDGEPDEEGVECAMALSELVLNRPVRARVESKQPSAHELSVSVLLPERERAASSAEDAAEGASGSAKTPTVPETLNNELVSLGLARVLRRPEARNHTTAAQLELLRATQEVAKKARLGIWKHGDVEEDDCKEFGFTPRNPEAPAWGKKK